MELLETPVKDGILYQQHVKFGKKSWRKVWGLLYAGGPSGVARLESWEVRDGGQGPAGDRSAGPGRRGERRVIRLADCVSVLPADGESCPRDTGAFLLTTTERSHLLAAQHRQAWIGSICQLAFPGTGESSSGSGEAEAPKRGPVPMEENSIYSSWKEVGEFPVVVQRTEAAARCQLKGPYLLLLGQDAIQLSEPASPQALYTWPYRFLRKFGSDKFAFSTELGWEGYGRLTAGDGGRSEGTAHRSGTMDSFKVVLEGPAPWGFRLQGGKDFNVPLSISRLTPGGKAAQAGVAVGDWVLSIDGENAGGLTHIEAQNKIRACGEHLSLGLSRAQPAQSKPQKPLRPLVPDASKQRLMEDTEDWRPRPGTGQSRSFRILAHLTGTEFMQDPDEEHLKKSREKYVLELQSPRYTRLRDWHHQRSAHVLNVQS
ncbi:hypothetical protein CB1_000228045 [Camelus ferus]|nr:hypothetical protein CB1_000228045 [Camelus ferus]